MTGHVHKVVLTGGGTAGHVTPNIALKEVLQSQGWKIDYVGSPDGVEKQMIEAINIPYHAVQSGKLRRYFSWQNVIDPLKVLWGTVQSIFLLHRIKPDVVFSKGGFVALPVVIGAYMNRIPVVAHESDMTPGLANRLSFPFVTTLCLTFEASKRHFKRHDKMVVTGTPIRQTLFQGEASRGLALCGFTADKPCVLVVGGSQGSTGLNAIVRGALPELTREFQVIHLCGKGKRDDSLAAHPGYFQLEYANEELPDLLAASDLVVSRSGANALSEILALGKPHVLIPLSMNVSRGDQIHNARYFKEMGISTVLDDDNLSVEGLLEAIRDVFQRRVALTAKIKALNIGSATDRIIALLTKVVTP